MDIPIKNIFYLLCYAYNKLDEGQIIDVELDDNTELVNLIAHVLLSGTTHLLKQGIDKGYETISEDTNSLKGKINFSTSLKRNLLFKAKVNCSFDNFSPNILHNRILKSCLNKVIKVENIDFSIKSGIIKTLLYFQDVEDIDLNKSTFKFVQLNANNSFYKFLLNICELFIDCILPAERTGTYKFKDFIRDEKKMPFLFEEFVRNFYRIEQNDYYVTREYVEWDAIALDDISKKYMPRMQTDISMESKYRKIIIETKFYKDAFQRYYDVEKLRQGNLLQLFGYLKHSEKDGGLNVNCEGILLYPTVQKDVDVKFLSQGHLMKAVSINLNQNWLNIKRDLISILN